MKLLTNKQLTKIKEIQTDYNLLSEASEIIDKADTNLYILRGTKNQITLSKEEIQHIMNLTNGEKIHICEVLTLIKDKIDNQITTSYKEAKKLYY